MSAQTAADLRAALALIPDAEHWCQGGNGGVRKSATLVAYCASQAIRAAIPNTRRGTNAIDAVLAAAGGGEYLADWNDAPGRTYADVRAAFERAIAAEEAAA